MNEREQVIAALEKQINVYKCTKQAASFLSGAMAFIFLPNLFFLRNSLGATSAEVSVFMGVTLLPWNVKPLYGYLSDCVFLFKYRIKSYFILSGCLLMVMCLLIASIKPTISQFTMLVTIKFFCSAILDTLGEGLITISHKMERDLQELKGESEILANSNVSNFILLRQLNQVFFSCLGGLCYNYMSIHQIYMTMMILPLTLLYISIFYFSEEKQETYFSANRSIRKDLALTVALCKDPQIYLPLALMTFTYVMPDTGSLVQFYLIGNRGFSKNEISLGSLTGGLIQLPLLLFLVPRLRTKSISQLFLMGSLFQAGTFSLQLLMFNLPSDPTFNQQLDKNLSIFGIYAVSMYALLSVGNNLISIGFFSNFAKFCPNGFESTGYSVFASFLNVYNSMSKIMAGYLINKLGITGPQYLGASLISILNLCMISAFLILLPFLTKILEQNLVDRSAVKEYQALDKSGQRQKSVHSVRSAQTLKSGRHSRQSTLFEEAEYHVLNETFEK